MDEDTRVWVDGGSIVDVGRRKSQPSTKHGASVERSVCRVGVGRMPVLEEDALIGSNIPADQTAMRLVCCETILADAGWTAKDGSKCRRDARLTHQRLLYCSPIHVASRAAHGQSGMCLFQLCTGS